MEKQNEQVDVQILKEAAYESMKDIMSSLFELNVIGPKTYSACTDKESFMKNIDTKYKYIKIINKGE